MNEIIMKLKEIGMAYDRKLKKDIWTAESELGGVIMDPQRSRICKQRLDTLQKSG
jgi:hypothetical protein